MANLIDYHYILPQISLLGSDVLYLVLTVVVSSIVVNIRKFFSITAECHFDSPSCNSQSSQNIVDNITFTQCCASNSKLQTSFLNTAGECVNCATRGKHWVAMMLNIFILKIHT